MPNPASEEEIKANFDRLLDVVHQTAEQRGGRMVGETHSVLVEESSGTKLTGRLSQNTLVHFEGDPSLVGMIVDVKLTEAHGFYYLGKIN